MQNTMIILIPLFFYRQPVLKFENRLKLSKYVFAHQKDSLPEPLMNMININRTIHSHNTRNINNPHMERRRTNKTARTIRHRGAAYWYQIPYLIRESKTIKSFSSKLRRHIIEAYYLHALIL